MTHIRGTRIETEVEIYATNLANKKKVHQLPCIEKLENQWRRVVPNASVICVVIVM
jgi:hypothetical protein